VSAFEQGVWTVCGDARLVLAGAHPEMFADRGYQDLPFVDIVARPSASQLAELYRNAAAVVTASANEGFGLPVAEALASGSEVIVPDVPVFRETVGEHGHYYDPCDTAGFAELSRRALEEMLPSLARGYQAPSWSQVADRVDVAIRLAGSQRVDRSGEVDGREHDRLSTKERW